MLETSFFSFQEMMGKAGPGGAANGGPVGSSSGAAAEQQAAKDRMIAEEAVDWSQWFEL